MSLAGQIPNTFYGKPIAQNTEDRMPIIKYKTNTGY